MPGGMMAPNRPNPMSNSMMNSNGIISNNNPKPINGGLNVDDIIKKIDAKIAEIEEEEKKQKEEQEKLSVTTMNPVEKKESVSDIPNKESVTPVSTVSTPSEEIKMKPVISPIKEEVKPQDTVVEKKPFTIDDLLRTNSTGMVTPSKKVEDIPLKETPKIEENKKKEELGKEVQFDFWEKYDEDHTVIRFATSWGTKMEDIDALIELL